MCFDDVFTEIGIKFCWCIAVSMIDVLLLGEILHWESAHVECKVLSDRERLSDGD